MSDLQPSAPDRTELRFALALVLVLLCWVASHTHLIEGWSWVDSFYFAASTLSTVGYGDLVPTHTLTKILVTIDMVFSVGIFVYATSLLTRYRFASSEEAFLARIRRLMKHEEQAIEDRVAEEVAVAIEAETGSDPQQDRVPGRRA